MGCDFWVFVDGVVVALHPSDALHSSHLPPSGGRRMYYGMGVGLKARALFEVVDDTAGFVGFDLVAVDALFD